MKKSVNLFAAAFVITGLSLNVFATNGDNMIGVGPTSRAMGGTGMAAPQDAISAIFNNPAGLSQIEGSQFNFAGTFFSPEVKATVVSPAPAAGVGNWSAKSQDEGYAIPAIGIATPAGENLTFGIAAYGVSGMGVDYRNKDVNGKMNTKVSVMKFVPALAYKRGAFSYGAGLDIDYQAADFGKGLAHNYAFGLRAGAGYEYGKWAFGVTYVTPQNVKHERVYDFDGEGAGAAYNGYDALKLENPAQYGAGVAYKGLDKWLLSADVKYVDWANADGYSDFDWESQTVIGLGVQNKTTDKLTLRAGWNYGKNPLKKHAAFNAMGTTDVQGMAMNTFNYEYFRIIGFPGVVEHHITLGAGYEFSPKFTLNLGYKKALAKSISETDSSGAISIKSELSETAYDMGLTFKF
ncbi:MAG: outer membrane protein transport protein [Elusimicrobiales bacterium]|nr:outer membrane protein transport protein [Elusimicrobiales bacterium]